MESVSNELVQIEDNDGSRMSPTCLRIPNILRQIMEYFSESELLLISLVNKQWNYEARSAMKDRGTTIAHLYGPQPCKDLAVFASHVQKMNVVPYSGIHLYFDRHVLEEPCSRDELDSSIDVILNRLPLKNFAVKFNDNWMEFYGCPALLFVKKVLQHNCGVLESLSVLLQSNFGEFILQTIQHSTFPRLKKLKLLRFSKRLETFTSRARRIEMFSLQAERMACSRVVRIIIQTMVSRTPNLKELRIDHPEDGYEYLLQGSSVVLVVDSEIDPLFAGVADGLIGALRLTRMRLESKAGPYFSIERFNHIVPAVLQTSSSTLRELSLELAFAPNLMRYRIPFKNVTRLLIFLNDQSELDAPQCEAADVSPYLRILQVFDFTYILPKLSEVGITRSRHPVPGVISQFVDQGNVILQERSPVPAVQIKRLKLHRLSINVPFLASLFPDITALAIETRDGPPLPYGLIWEHWTHLKQLVVQDRGVWRTNLDSLFCGLFPEEIAELREKDEEYLKAVNIVPIMPSITCLKELRTF